MQKEYLVSEQFTRRILTEDKSFSFENGMAEVYLLFLVDAFGQSNNNKMEI